MHTRSYILSIVLLLLSTLLIGLLGYQIYTLRNTHEATRGELSATEEQLQNSKTAEDALRISHEELTQKLIQSEAYNAELLLKLTEEQERNEAFENQISNISGTVGKLDKLSKLDAELLQKYSRVYFLNEHYTPSNVTTIDPTFVKNTDGMMEYIHAGVAPFLQDLLTDAYNDGISLFVISAYRSYDEQAGLKNAYSVQYGAGANTFSADQGYSEHQLGTTVDFSSDEIGGGLTDFQNTKAFAWLEENAHRYGFTLSYPEANEYYIYEPWHWRFVGQELADDLYDDGKHFYDYDQRTIDEYLISIFD